MPLTAALSRGGAVSTAAPPTRRRPSGAPPPLPHDLRRSGWLWAGLATAVVISWLVVFVTDLRPYADDLDSAILRWVADLRSGALTRLMRRAQWLGADRTIVVLQLAVVAVALAFRRFRHVIVLAACSLFGVWMTSVVQVVVARPRPSAVEILGRWNGFSHPSRPVVGLSLTVVAAIYVLVPKGRWRIARAPDSADRRRGISPVNWVCLAVILLLCFAEVYLGVSHPTDVVLGGIMGVAIPLIAFRVLAPAEVFPITYRRQRTAHVDVGGRRGAAIQRAVGEQLGLEAESVEPFALEGSWGSTPVLIRLADPDRPTLFGKIYTATHLRSDRWYKLGRTLLYGRLEDEATFPTVRRLVEYEDYLLRVMWAAGLPVARTYGFLEITPEREYVIVNEFLTGAREIGDVEVDEAVIDDALRVVRGLWDAGLAHRDIKPANILVRDKKVFLVDVAFGEVRPSPWRQAVDLANMMVVLSLSSDPDVVYERARLLFSDDELAEAFAAARGVTLPNQSRARLRQDERDVLGRLRALAPPRPPIRIQHWSLRRIGLSVGVIAGAAVALFAFVNAVRSLQLW
ncbi:MAG TPA: phosphatase PAP2 family protein [Acidimicrobiales bacterium]|nr:phosphatase PAP2 family protein [Acidimicrobiales bacterium]